MSTKNRFNKFIVNNVPLLFPPQIMMLDDEYYKATIIHEMVHAYQAINNQERFMRSELLHNVCDNYYSNQVFNDLIEKEAYYLEQAIITESYGDTLLYTQKFLKVRDERRTECEMSINEIQNEVDFEWLEGLARYAEYKASVNSNSLLAKNILNIDQKVKIKGDDRYYTLGMAQSLVLDKLDVDWKSHIFNIDFSMEEYLKKICLAD